MQGEEMDLDPETHAQVARLLGAARAGEMLGLLRETLARLDDMPEDDLVGPCGLAAVHRLKSESGMMGFRRLSRACDTVDAAGARGAVPLADLGSLRHAVGSALAIVDAMVLRHERPRP